MKSQQLKCKPSRKAVFIGIGEHCVKCEKPMERMSHPKDWTPRNGIGYFTEWDVCRFCRHVQHYQRFYVRGGFNDGSTEMAIKEAKSGSMSAVREAQAERELCALQCLLP